MKLYRLLLTLLVLISTSALAVEKTNTAQADEIRQRVRQIAPYNADEVKQIFTKTVHGGVQHIVVKLDNNTEQIKLIQAYLLKLANNFSSGDFSVTEQIHGANMPGLAQLKMAQPYDIKFEYKKLPNGAQIHYSTEYPLLAQALHEWFDAQKHDHNDTTIQEHSQHHLTPAD